MSENERRGGGRRDGQGGGQGGARRGGQNGRGQGARGQGPRRPDRQGARPQQGPRAERTDRPQQRGPRRTPLDPARRAAFDVLRAVSERDAYANLALPAMLRDRDITGRDAAFATELAYGTCRSIGLLDAVIEHAAGRTTDKIDPVLLDLLRLGSYQLLRTRVDAHAAVDTTVEQAGIEFDSVRAGFVNGVLRTIAAKDEAAWVAELAPRAATDPIGHTAFVHAHPRWVAQSFADALGADAGELDAMLTSDDERPVVHLAARAGEMTAVELAAAVGGEIGRYSPYAVYLPGGDPGQLDPVREGWAQVQDEGSQLVARALTEVPLVGSDNRWLDLCAGPGGKTAMLASIAALCGATVTAVEPAEHRAELVERNTRGLDVQVLRVDGRESGLQPGSFDRVLVDAPCTGLGALRRRPEARWRRQPGDVPALAKLQRELLAAAIKLTRPGGVVLYATCSPHLAETVGVIADAVRRQPVEVIDTRPLFAPADRLGPGPHVQLWPHRHGTDAMFAAALKVV
jgi:16S rRNA (cytosine967-C5)-methyltransferase